MEYITFLLAVFFVVINGVTQMYLARSYGFKLKATGWAYLVGAIANIFTQSVVPISGQAETLTLSGQIKSHRQRVAALLIAAVIGIIVGLTGTLTNIVEFAGNNAVLGMMSGVGLILAMVGVDMCKQEKRVGIVSMVAAFVIYGLTQDLVYTIAGSVTFSCLDFCILQRRRVSLSDIPADAVESEEWRFWKKEYWADFKLRKPAFGLSAVFGGLSFICLNIGSNISFGQITAGIAGQDAKLDALSFVNSLADIPSVLFGGAPIEAIISGTAAAPDIFGLNGPWLAGVLMMVISAVLLLTGIIGKMGRFIPAQSIAGFLFIIGFNVTLIPDLKSALTHPDGDVASGLCAAAATFVSKNAFVGLCVGTLVHQVPKLVPALIPLLG